MLGGDNLQNINRKKHLHTSFILSGYLLIIVFCFIISWVQNRQQLCRIFYDDGRSILVKNEADDIFNDLNNLEYNYNIGDKVFYIDNPKYRIQGEHKSSNKLDFQFQVYNINNSFYVMDCSKFKYNNLSQSQYNLLSETLEKYKKRYKNVSFE